MQKSSEIYCGRHESLNLDDKILSPGVRVEPEAIFLPASEGERGCQDSKDVGINPNFHADRSILKKIKEHLRKGTYILSEHAVTRQKERLVRLTDILYVLEFGRHEQDKDIFDVKYQHWKHAIRGRTVDNVDLRVIIAFHEKLAIITIMRVKR